MIWPQNHFCRHGTTFYSTGSWQIANLKCISGLPKDHEVPFDTRDGGEGGTAEHGFPASPAVHSYHSVEWVSLQTTVTKCLKGAHFHDLFKHHVSIITKNCNPNCNRKLSETSRTPDVCWPPSPDPWNRNSCLSATYFAEGNVALEDRGLVASGFATVICEQLSSDRPRGFQDSKNWSQCLFVSDVLEMNRSFCHERDWVLVLLQLCHCQQRPCVFFSIRVHFLPSGSLDDNRESTPLPPDSLEFNIGA